MTDTSIETKEERYRRKQREWREANPDYNKVHYANNRDKIKSNVKLWRKSNPELVRKYVAKCAKRPKQKLVTGLRRKLSNFMRSKVSRIEMFGCSPKQLREHVERMFTEGMNWDNYGQWHLDHIVPCSAFDLTNSDHVKTCFHFNNLRPLWAMENIIKRDKNEFPQLRLPI